MSGPMVRAVLNGTKTQTRRVISNTGLYAVDKEIHGAEVAERDRAALATRCPHGKPGDLLWIRETWNPHCDCNAEGAVDAEHPLGTCVKYQSDGAMIKPSAWNEEEGFWCEAREQDTKWRPSIFMPRWASRITLEILSVKVERVQEISENDAMAEGVVVPSSLPGETYRGCFAKLWNMLHIPRHGCSWDSNPYVFCISFRKL